MPFYDLGCPGCHAEYVDVWMRTDETRDCGCGVTLERLWRTRTVIGDECDITQENGFAHPTHFTSKSVLKKALDGKGLEMHVRHMPIPGTDKSPHTSDWSRGCVDLAGATALVTHRMGSTGKHETPSDAPIMGTWTVRDWEPR